MLEWQVFFEHFLFGQTTLCTLIGIFAVMRHGEICAKNISGRIYIAQLVVLLVTVIIASGVIFSIELIMLALAFMILKSGNSKQEMQYLHQFFFVIFQNYLLFNVFMALDNNIAVNDDWWNFINHPGILLSCTLYASLAAIHAVYEIWMNR